MLKRIFDVALSLLLIILLCWLLLLLWITAAIATGSSGIFLQKRVGRYAKLFTIYKFRTITFTAEGAPEISRTGNIFRRYKLDELPQLLNILKGDMSFVGPRPDVPGYYDKLIGEDAKVLELRPGLTGPASLKYFDEERLLADKQNPLEYNDKVIFPDKVKINLEYYYRRSFVADIKIIFATIFRSA